MLHWGSWEKTLVISQEEHVAMDTDYNPERNLLSNPMGAICTHVSVWSPNIAGSCSTCSRLILFSSESDNLTTFDSEHPCLCLVPNHVRGFPCTYICHTTSQSICPLFSCNKGQQWWWWECWKGGLIMSPVECHPAEDTAGDCELHRKSLICTNTSVLVLVCSF